MRRLLMALALLAAPLAAQDAKNEPPKEPLVQKLFVLKYANPNQMANLISVFSAKVVQNTEMRALAVTAPREAMTAIEDAIQRLDVPSAAPQNVELTVYMVIGANDGAAGPPLPKDLDPVVAQLKNAFSYKSYRLMDVYTLRTRTGQEVQTSGTSGEVKAGNQTQPINTQVRIGSVTVNPDGVIRIDNLRTDSRVPVASSFTPTPQGAGVSPVVNTTWNYLNVGLSANVDVKEGQKVVVGKSGMNPNEALFVVLSGRVAQ